MPNTISLKEYFDKLREADKEAIKIALDSADKANDKSEKAQAKVNETQNEFRGALKDKASTLMPRIEAENKFDGQQKQLDDVKRLVYIGIGIVITLQVLLQFIK